MDGVPVREFEERARRRLAPVLYDYFAGGAGDELTVRENEAAFARIRLVPRVLRGSDKRQLDVTVLGCPASMPVLISPTAFTSSRTRTGSGSPPAPPRPRRRS
jgi:4-hydroxymandelate oxidase